MKKFVLLILLLLIFTCLVSYRLGKQDGYRDCVNDNYYTIIPNKSWISVDTLIGNAAIDYINRISVKIK